ncbi:MAG: 3-hydroxyacyl-ACP dehydratase FabZ [Nitrospinaceae bacterium]|nr:3-hydroxyacyl-ACP dehydratase FabZ [Nitrospinaceae bacterium]NIR57142.1 3-hydroxyacyl-ACP dehydratase FabZ [Nitrospinaceae bacterium]NIS87584.1 3-hydroxyacyl-ACP dehydratase FabZ [Nitrospinaceae bacterium]NIT84453.1 3-hydroxyacyl-ACP dehydratase FabZ [Nitrospinaceae bacterium]NIU46641.1 3-hydroxyacyl-ACP dehydratase FabZ [Nitrospinaceae bacterium]
MLDINDIKKIIPHRYPFLLVDKIIECDDDSNIVGLKTVTANEPFFQGHFPEFPVMPGVLIVEAMAQVACILALRVLKKEGHASVFFTGIDGVKFRKPVVPGDVLRLELTKTRQRGELFRFDGKALVEDQVVTQGTIQAVLGKS